MFIASKGPSVLMQAYRSGRVGLSSREYEWATLAIHWPRAPSMIRVAAGKRPGPFSHNELFCTDVGAVSAIASKVNLAALTEAERP
jgi:hypothetical protein